MMEFFAYAARCIFMLLVTWTALRILGKKTLAQVTTYELAGILLLTTAAAEPLVYKIASKATVGVASVTIGIIFLGWLALKLPFYNIDLEPSILIANGKIDKQELGKNDMNLTFLLSQLRLKGYAKVSDVEFAILETSGQISVIPKSQSRPVQPSDLKIETKYEGIALPLILEGKPQYKNLEYANLTVNWLEQEIKKAGAQNMQEIYFAELDTQGKLFVDLYQDSLGEKPPVF